MRWAWAWITLQPDSKPVYVQQNSSHFASIYFVTHKNGIGQLVSILMSCGHTSSGQNWQRMTRYLMKTWRKRRQKKNSHGSDKQSPKKKRLVGVSALSPHTKVNTTISVISGRLIYVPNSLG